MTHFHPENNCLQLAEKILVIAVGMNPKDETPGRKNKQKMQLKEAKTP